MNAQTDRSDARLSDSQLGVFGFGNPMRGDDGIAPMLFDSIRAREGAIDADLVEFGSRTFRVVHALREYDRVLLVDAMCFGGEAGDVVVCRPEEVVSQSATTGPHELDLLELVELTAQLSQGPATVRVFGIQPGPMGATSELSTPVENRLPAIRDRLLETIATL